MNLANGSRLAIEVEPLDGGRLRVALRTRVGHSGSKDLAPPKICSGWAEAWAAIELLAQERLARIGLEAVDKRR